MTMPGCQTHRWLAHRGNKTELKQDQAAAEGKKEW